MVLLFVAAFARGAAGQEFPRAPYFARVNTFGFFAGFSNDSSHILVGLAEQRKLLNIGFSYDRRLHVGNVVNWQYDLEAMPVALESDPLARIVVQQSAPDAESYTYYAAPPITCGAESSEYSGEEAGGSTYTGTETVTCGGRRWTYGEAISPLGLDWNFLPRRRTQPYFDVHGGSMFTSRVIPIAGAAAKNFTFDGGVGLEWFLSPARSLRAEFRLHHISNADTANLNPGIDNGMFLVSYCFGR